jgi:hypothetical protein
MSDDFRSVAAGLWRSLDLPPPAFSPEGSAVLTFGNIPIELSASGDGRHIHISARAGTLSDNPALMDDQITHILKETLRALPFSRACASLVRQDSKPPSIAVCAAAPCNTAFMDLLVESIGDVLHLAEKYARELARYSSAAPRWQRLEEETFPDAIILQP